MDFKFPDVGEGLTEGTLLKWLVKVGDAIKLDQPLAQVETDKAVVDIPAPVSGTVAELIGNEGDTLTVGVVMARFDTDGSKATIKPTGAQSIPKVVPVARVESQPQTDTQPKSQTQQAPVSHLGPILAMPAVRKFAKDHNLDLSQIIGSGKHGQIQLSDVDGAPSVAKSVNASVESQQALESVGPDESAQVKLVEEFVHPFIPINKNTVSATVLATPSVRRAARERGIDITQVSGSGENGKILLSDLDNAKHTTTQVKAAVQSTPVSLSGSQLPKPAPAPSPQTAKSLGGQTRVPLSKTRQVIAKRMVESLQHTASVTTTEEVDVTNLYALYEQEKALLKEQNIRLSFLAFVTKIVTLALKKHPLFNSTLDEATNEIVMHDDINIGIAVATPTGLLVPVIKQAQNLSITDIAQSIFNLAKTARDGKLSLSQMGGSTFTISNIGSIGGAMFTPIINYPEVAILGVGRTVEKPAVVEGEICIRKMMWLSLTFDHRVGDGADAAFFLNLIKQYLEDEKSLLVNMS